MATKRYAEVIPILNEVLSDGHHWWHNEALKDRIIAGKALNQNDPEFSKYAVLYIDYMERKQAADIANKTKELQIVYDVNNLEKQVSDLQIEKDKSQIRSSRIIIISSFAAVLVLAFLLAYVIRSRAELSETNRMLQVAQRKAEYANSMKTMFVENMNHEIRTPLNAVVGFSDIIANDNDSMSQEERKSYSSIIRENSDMLLAMVSDLLDISDMESEGMKFKSEPCSLNEVCGDATATYKSRVSDKVALVFNPHENDLNIMSDKQRLSQVVRNYISNAVKNTETGSIVVDYSDDPQARKVTLSVTDTGCGVPPDKADEIFKRFEKLDNFKEGTGIGLNICKMIADGLHAESKLDSSYTGGARFLFILPY
jgi:signal transduction histidine kinase